jgi:hypothetical protein
VIAAPLTTLGKLAALAPATGSRAAGTTATRPAGAVAGASSLYGGRGRAAPPAPPKCGAPQPIASEWNDGSEEESKSGASW